MTLEEVGALYEQQDRNMANARSRGKADATKHYLAARPEDIPALLDDAKARFDSAKSGTTASSYWLAYWGRLLRLRDGRTD